MSNVAPFPSGKYRAIYCDPPWRFNSWSSKGKKRSPENHYQTMTLEDIKALPVHTLAEKDCVLFMWVTMPMLPEALQVIDAWGFKYKTCAFTWMKQNKRTPPLMAAQQDIFTGLGYWTRANSEICLLATKGKPKRINMDVKQAILSPIREHSRKPECVYHRIERLVQGPYIELFSRENRTGWVSWGAESGKFNPLNVGVSK